MAHFAELDENNVVKTVLVVNDEYLKDVNGKEVEQLGKLHMEKVHGGKWVQTSYNNNFRVRYAGIGYTYDEALDAFIPPKPYASWVLNDETCYWEEPIPQPEPEEGFRYVWNEEELDWDKVEVPQPEPEEGFYYVWNEVTLVWNKVEVPPAPEETPQ